MPTHVGTPTPGRSYDDGDSNADFLPPATAISSDPNGGAVRADVFMASGMPTVHSAHAPGRPLIRPLTQP